jgi:hypothetical protein
MEGIYKISEAEKGVIQIALAEFEADEVLSAQEANAEINSWLSNPSLQAGEYQTK